ncbi:MAG: O-methyltransferase [Erysipelotrichaceae bacterium]|nr:O-methyltransferase [Erysipelotrichaceae bacterium]
MDEMKEYAQKKDVPVLQDASLEQLLKWIKDNQVCSFLEIGTAIAKTSIAVATSDPQIKVVTIERDPQMIRQAQQNIRNAGLTDRITLIEGDALDVCVTGVFDCIFIDAAKAQYRRFFEKFAPLLSNNGIIITDNMNFHGLVDHPERTQNRNTKALVRKIKSYREYLQSLTDYQTTFYDIGDGMAITRRES